MFWQRFLMLRVIGIGPGRPEWLPPAVKQLVSGCDILIGGSRALKLFPDFSGLQYTLSGNLSASLEVIAEALSQKKLIGVLVSGDPGFFSFLPRLRKKFPEEAIDVYPGISSLQFAFAKAKLPWHNAGFFSIHGRELSALPQVISRPTAVLTGGKNTPQKIAQFYLNLESNPQMSVGNALAYPEEIWETIDARNLAQEQTEFKNAIVILYPSTQNGSQNDPFNNKPAEQLSKSLDSKQNTRQNRAFKIGIPDHEFLRGNVPMTKAEIRVQVLAKAQIAPTDCVADIGAGTGSISIEAAGLASEGIVYAIERKAEAQELILANQKKFGVSNLQLISGTAPDVFGELPSVNVCIIGGSSGRLAEILKYVPLLEGGKIVVTAVTLETMSQSLQLLKALHYREIEVISIQAVRWQPVQKIHMAQALNPVFILSARKEEKLCP